ncbi:AAA family ATPase [Bradyrhizobium sp. B120]|uniref:AAA family ATPase n=1 Tax=Bradyrhizobium sp. B120 TaxID=3410088 RepID=UPI003B986905
MDVEGWLQELGLEQYGTLFRANEVDAEVLLELTENDLEKLGVPLGHRKRLLKAIAKLSATETAEVSQPTSAEPSPRDAAERRQLTVMFCDLVGSTALSARLDPEDMREVMRSYQDACSGVIARYEGFVAKFLGDGIVAYFGYPLAHEDDAERAVRAGLEIVAVLAGLETRAADLLQIRIGIATGVVVVGDLIGQGSAQEHPVVGDTPNLAARLQSVAHPGSIVVSEQVRRLAGGTFDYEDLGELTLKGIAPPTHGYRIRGISKTASRFEAATSAGLTALVGRHSEVSLLQDRWAQVVEGTGQVVCLSGEAGIGKSRLVHMLRAHVSAGHALCFSASGSAYHQNTALHPVIDLLQGLLGFEPGDDAPARLAKLHQGLALHGLGDARMASVFAALLSLPSEAGQPAATAGTQKETLEAILTLLLALAAHKPVLLVVEDLHWLDPSTLELLGLLIDQVPTANILLLTAARPNFQPPWGARPQVNALRLGRLARSEISQLVLQVTGSKPLPAEVLEQIIKKTDGVPLFVEELTKTVMELGLLRDLGERYELVGPLTPLAIPATVHDSLMARLDRLSTAKTVAQLGAVLGRSFAYDLLHAVAKMDEATLRQSLQQLVVAEVLQQHGLPPSATYTFKHALVQDAAYGSLLRSTRQLFHQRVAQVLVESFATLTQGQPEVLAYHYTEAGLAAQAIPQWQRAAQLSVGRAAHREAISQFNAALGLLAGLPAGSERSKQELEVRLGLGPALMAARGYAAPEVERTYERARELANELGEAEQRFTILFGLWRYYLNRARLAASRGLAEQLIASAEESGVDTQWSMARYAMGTTQYYQGEIEPAAANLEQAVALYDPRQHVSVAASDPRITSLSCGAWALWHQGLADQALMRSEESVRLAHELSHLPSLAHALYYASLLHQFRRAADRARDCLQQLMACSTERGFSYWEARGSVLQGWLLGEEGHTAEGIRTMLRGIEAVQATGAELAQPNYLAMLAELYLKNGEAAAGLRAVNDALERIEHTLERRWQPELLRLKAELLLAEDAGAADAARDSLHQALALARRQNNRSLELRAAMSLYRLERHHRGRRDGHQLQTACSAFTEGYDEPDLREARTLLQAS